MYVERPSLYRPSRTSFVSLAQWSWACFEAIVLSYLAISISKFDKLSLIANILDDCSCFANWILILAFCVSASILPPL